MKLREVKVGMAVIARTSGIHTGKRGKVIAIVDSTFETKTKLARVKWEDGKILNWHPVHLEAAK